MKNDGGSAFPVAFRFDERQGEYQYTASAGLSLRDYFAAKAMQGMLACPMQPQSGPDMFARDAYVVADAMLKARES